MENHYKGHYGKKKRFTVRIDLFDREALNWARTAEWLRKLFEETGNPEIAKEMSQLRDLFTNALLDQTNLKRAESITKNAGH